MNNNVRWELEPMGKEDDRGKSNNNSRTTDRQKDMRQRTWIEIAPVRWAHGVPKTKKRKGEP